MTEAKAPEGYDPRAYNPVGLAVDLVCLTIRNGKLSVLLIERGEDPYAGAWALPGGFVKNGNTGPHTDDDGEFEDADTAAIREAHEEAGIDLRAEGKAGHLEQLKTYTAPHRDPRMRTVSVAYLVFAPNLPEPQAGSDASDARWWTIEDIEDPETGVKLAFDHAEILADGIERVRSKIEYTTLATQFLSEPFTIGELRNVYEAVWGQAPNQSNFWRKVLKTEGFVVPVEGKVSQSAGGPKAQLYRRGEALWVQPPMMRPSPSDDDEDPTR